jgi:virulence factor Mce-like protein
MSRRIRVANLLVGIAVAVSSCASINVNQLPQPGNNYGDGYDITMQFANVLNLPERAKVVQDGTTVGVVTKVAVAGPQVDVTARISPAAVVPSNTHAVLQQATVLGDIYVALERAHAVGEPTAPPLRPGGTVPISQTTSPPQLEDTIANLANFISSGSIQRMQDTIIGINRVSPADPDAIRKLSTTVAVDLADLSNNMDLVDQLLTNLSGTAQVLDSRTASYQQWFSPGGMLAFDRGLIVAGYVGTLIPSVGSVYAGGFWLVPLLDSLANAMGAVQQSKWAFEDEVPRWRRLFTDYFLPQDKYPAINITSIVGPDGREMIGNVQDVLRILGAAP